MQASSANSMLLGAVVIVSAWALTYVYAWWANKDDDAGEVRLRRERL